MKTNEEAHRRHTEKLQNLFTGKQDIADLTDDNQPEENQIPETAGNSTRQITQTANSSKREMVERKSSRSPRVMDRSSDRSPRLSDRSGDRSPRLRLPEISGNKKVWK